EADSTITEVQKLGDGAQAGVKLMIADRCQLRIAKSVTECDGGIARPIQFNVLIGSWLGSYQQAGDVFSAENLIRAGGSHLRISHPQLLQRVSERIGPISGASIIFEKLRDVSPSIGCWMIRDPGQSRLETRRTE